MSLSGCWTQGHLPSRPARRTPCLQSAGRGRAALGVRTTGGPPHSTLPPGGGSGDSARVSPGPCSVCACFMTPPRSRGCLRPELGHGAAVTTLKLLGAPGVGSRREGLGQALTLRAWAGQLRPECPETAPWALCDSRCPQVPHRSPATPRTTRLSLVKVPVLSKQHTSTLPAKGIRKGSVQYMSGWWEPGSGALLGRSPLGALPLPRRLTELGQGDERGVGRQRRLMGSSGGTTEVRISVHPEKSL